MWLLVVLSIFGETPYGTSSDQLDGYLADLQGRKMAYPARVAMVARDAVGTTYADGPLGEGPTGVYDQDPLIDLARVDCVTYVEQCLALAAARSYEDAVAKLQTIRYAGGRVDFSTRNHFMVADWLSNNPWCVARTTELGVPFERLTRTISKRDFFKLVKAPELGGDIADRAVSIAYIPAARASEAAAAIRVPALVVFIGKIDWLFALHCGLYVPEAGGGGKLYHASSKAGAVTATDLDAYVASQSKRYLGFTVHEITTPPFADEAGVPTH